jgi:hypothetical protein
MTDMTRRQFVKTGITLVGGVAATLVVGSCGPEVAVPAAAATLSAAKPVAEWFGRFATSVGASIISSVIVDWAANAGGRLGSEANAANNQMQSAGFNVYASNVYQYVFPSNTITFYAMGANGGFNACAPFIRNDGKALVEGPVIMGLALSCLNWSSTDVPPADGLLITKALQTVGSDFMKTEPNPFKFTTRAGNLAIQYASIPEKQQGQVSVVAKKDNGGLLHGQDYLVQWS